MTTPLRKAMRGIWATDEKRTAARDLAGDTGLDAAIIAKVLDGAAAELRTDCDGWQVVQSAIEALTAIGLHVAQPFDAAKLEQLLSAIPEPDATILREYRSGKRHQQIAALLGMDEEVVLRALSRTYAGLRMEMIGAGQ